MPWIWIIVYSVMDGCPHTTHIYHVFEISVVLVYIGFPMAVVLVGHVLINNFTPLSLSGLML